MYIMGTEEEQVRLVMLLVLYKSITKQVLQHFFYSIDCLETHLFQGKHTTSSVLFQPPWPPYVYLEGHKVQSQDSESHTETRSPEAGFFL